MIRCLTLARLVNRLAQLIPVGLTTNNRTCVRYRTDHMSCFNINKASSIVINVFLYCTHEFKVHISVQSNADHWLLPA